jgi:F0F1-type ATP synthase membrane subunit c/vacuolar-type H+-ATPase subunit K
MFGRRRDVWKGAVAGLIAGLSVHVCALLSHFVFGATAEGVRRQLRARL